jgi:hypothetical protein
MTTVYLSREELRAIKSTLEDVPPNHDRDEKRARLKKLSDDRQAHWPNTLEAMRKKREAAFRDKEAIAEQKRKEIDREEAERRRVERLESINRANDLLYEQTDCMKVLRSKELYSDCLHERKSQIREKQRVKDELLRENQAHHEVVLNNVKIAEEKEKEKLRQQQKTIADVTEVRENQLREVRAQREAYAAEQVAIGLQMRRDTEIRAEEEQKALIEKARVTKEKNYEFLMGNEQLKELKRQIQLQEQQDNERREAEVDVIENRKKVRKALEQRRFEKAQETRLRLIDRATQLLAEKTNNDNAILSRQINEQREKEDKKFADKEAHRKLEWQKTIESRNQQIQSKKERVITEKDEEQRMVNRWQKKNADDNATEQRKQHERHENIINLKKLQMAQQLEKNREKNESALIDAERERLYREQGDDEDARFKEICKREINRYAADGKPVYPLYRAMEYKRPDLLPVSGFRI